MFKQYHPTGVPYVHTYLSRVQGVITGLSVKVLGLLKLRNE